MMPKSTTIVCLLAGLFCFAGVKNAFAQDWWDTNWEYRRAIIVEPKVEAFAAAKVDPTGRQACQVALLVHGQAKGDLGDIRVVGTDNKTRPYLVMAKGPGDLVRIAFPVSGKTKRKYYIYYGNPNAKAEKTTWEPKTGLILETYEYAGGSIGELKYLESTIAKAKTKLVGRAFVPTVFTPANIFGPQSKTCSVHTGYLICQKPGTYTFALTTWDAGALYIDGR